MGKEGPNAHFSPCFLFLYVCGRRNQREREPVSKERIRRREGGGGWMEKKRTKTQEF